MDFYKNVDKQCWDEFAVALYNTVLQVSFDDDNTEPVSLDDAKLWCKIDDNDTDDDLLATLITSARIMCEQYSGVGFKSRMITASINNADGGFNLPYGPVTSTPTAVDIDNNVIDIMYNMGQIQRPIGPMVVSYTGGYATLPQNLITALKQQIIFMYENRGEGTIALSPMASMILLPLRKI